MELQGGDVNGTRAFCRPNSKRQGEQRNYDATSKTKAMKQPSIISIVCVLLCNGIAYAQPALPTWDQLQDLIGKEEEAPEIRRLLEEETTFLYQKQQTTDRLPNRRLKFVTVTQYGGAGFIIVVEEDKLIGFPTRDATKVMRPAKVARVLLILGNCEEAEQLGKWKGALPEGLQLPSDPEDLLRQHNEADSDREKIVNSGGIELSRRRSIYFGEPIPENSKFPYGFIFDANQFSILVLLPLRQSTIIPPIKPIK